MKWPATRPGLFIPREKLVIMYIGSWSSEPEKIKSLALPGFELGERQGRSQFSKVLVAV